ncbi:MAG TPA: hypothetical protein VKA70_13015 [Blastocatellia bacterium]|nr:hypothetical protein [Blastocatellia bacterium]
MIKRIKLIAIVMLLSTYLWPANDAGAVAQQREYRRPDIVGDLVPYEERFTADDGAAFAIHFSGDIHGNLEPCG